MVIKKEIKWLNEQIDFIQREIKIAKKAKTRNGNQSAIIYAMFLMQLTKRKAQITK